VRTSPVVVGISDEVTTCDCCFRCGLKRTVALRFDTVDGDDDGTVYYGTTCASRAFPALGKPADIATIAGRMCGCGCGEFARVITVSGRRFATEDCRARVGAR
jgi:hypothetical protein